jgi:DNA polymerase-4
MDPRPVTPERKAKSVGREITYPADVLERQVLLDTLLDMSDHICRTLRRQGLVCQGVTLKIKYPDLKMVTRALTLPDHTSDGTRVFKAAAELLARHWKGTVPVRLIGVSASRLAQRESLPEPLFADPRRDRSRKLNSAVDGLLDRYGEKALVRGRLLGKDGKRRGE